MLEAVDQALRVGCPAIWNSDEGSHFTSSQYLGRLQERGIPISMDGKGRALDNIFTERLWRMVKYEEVQRAFYLKIPGVARRARGQQKMLPTLMGGALLETARAFRYEAGVSTLLLSLATYLAAGIPGHGLGSQRAVRRETPVLPTCSPPGEGRQSSVRGRTRISFVIGLGAPKRHDLVSLAPPFSVFPIFIRFHVGHRHRAS